MSMNNNQRWMGGVVLLGGGVLLAALLLKGKEEIHQQAHEQVPHPVEQARLKDQQDSLPGGRIIQALLLIRRLM